MIREREYDFETTLAIRAPKQAVWDALMAIPRWKEWWRAVKRASVSHESGAEVVGLTIGYCIYRLSFTILTGAVILGKSSSFSSRGDLTGAGQFTVSEDSGVTTVVFTWNVRTTKAWMNLLAPVGRPFFVYSHNLVMRWFAEGLTRKVGGALVSHRTTIKN